MNLYSIQKNVKIFLFNTCTNTKNEIKIIYKSEREDRKYFINL